MAEVGAVCRSNMSGSTRLDRSVGKLDTNTLFLQILSKEVKSCDYEDIIWQGRTRLRVTLIPDQVPDSQSSVVLSYLGRLEHDLKQARKVFKIAQRDAMTTIVGRQWQRWLIQPAAATAV